MWNCALEPVEIIRLKAFFTNILKCLGPPWAGNSNCVGYLKERDRKEIKPEKPNTSSVWLSKESCSDTTHLCYETRLNAWPAGRLNYYSNLNNEEIMPVKLLFSQVFTKVKIRNVDTHYRLISRFREWEKGHHIQPWRWWTSVFLPSGAIHMDHSVNGTIWSWDA